MYDYLIVRTVLLIESHNRSFNRGTLVSSFIKIFYAIRRIKFFVQTRCNLTS